MMMAVKSRIESLFDPFAAAERKKKLAEFTSDSPSSSSGTERGSNRSGVVDWDEVLFLLLSDSMAVDGAAADHGEESDEDVVLGGITNVTSTL